MQKFAYYENGKKEVFNLEQVKRLYDVVVDNEQKQSGTTFDLWLEEMERMQILIRFRTIQAVQKTVYFALLIDGNLTRVYNLVYMSICAHFAPFSGVIVLV